MIVKADKNETLSTQFSLLTLGANVREPMEKIIFIHMYVTHYVRKAF